LRKQRFIATFIAQSSTRDSLELVATIFFRKRYDGPAQGCVEEHHGHPGRAFAVEIVGAVRIGDIAERDGQQPMMAHCGKPGDRF
jgi:hypothetical protein